MEKYIYISFYFPPGFNVLKYRAYKLSNGLLKYNLKPIVITSLSRKKSLKKNIDKEFRSIPKEITVFRVPYIGIVPYLLNFLKIDDPFIIERTFEWVLIGLPLIYLKLKKINFKFIYATAPPFSSFVFGVILKLIFKKPLIIEYRDPWTDNPYHPYFKDKKKRIINYLKSFEKKILEFSDGIIFISGELRNRILSKYKLEYLNLKTTIIPNAIDPKKYQKLKQKKFSSSKLIFVLTSTLIGKRNPKPVFKLLSECIKQEILKDNQFEFHIYGYNDKDNINKLIDLYNLEKFIFNHGIVSHSQCIQAQKGANFLIDISESDSDYPTFPLHFWEYFASNKKIIYFGKYNSWKYLFIEKKYGYSIPLDKPKKMKEKFYKLIEEYKKGTLEMRNNILLKDLKTFSWNLRVERLFQFIKNFL